MAGWDGVPWWIGGPAQHSRELARLIVYVASQGSEGIIGIGDLMVRAQTIPDDTVRVMPGACIVRNRYGGGAYQSYAARLPTTDSPIDIAANTTGTARSDLVIARVEDPLPSGSPWQPYPSTDDRARVGPYVFSRPIPGVPAGTTDIRQISQRANDSAITLARIDVPPNTSTITQAMITDLRQMANPRNKTRLFGHSMVAAEAETLASTAAAGEYWPNVIGSLFQVDVPEWATRVVCRFEWSQVYFPGGYVAGSIWGQFGTESTPNYFTTQATGFDTTGIANPSRMSLSVADDLAVPASMRGTNISINPHGKMGAGYAAAARPVMDAGSSFNALLTFLEAPAEDISDVA
jgi:hypothetical protein